MERPDNVMEQEYIEINILNKMFVSQYGETQDWKIRIRHIKLLGSKLIFLSALV